MDLEKVTEELKNKYKDLGIEKIELNDGKASFYVRPTPKTLAFSESASVVYRDKISREILDLLSDTKLPSKEDPKKLFKKSYNYYWDVDVYGSVIDTLVNLSIKGFENDIGDHEIKYFYDSWCVATNFLQVLEWIFLDFFRIGMVRTYKIIGKFDLPVTHLTPPESMMKGRAFAARKKKWSKSHIPIAYTVLNPMLVDIEGSLLFDNTKVVLKANKELQEMLKKPVSQLTPAEKEIVKRLPSDFKNSIKKNKVIELDPELVGSIDYRKMPYERYPRPRGTRAFESIEYKNALREADLSTLDGISNYILKITVGNDQYPVTSQEELDKVAQLFNTPSKAFNVVWNHTLKIERIVSPEIESVLGKDKYEQVNEDLSGALAFPRAFLDGVQTVNSSTAAILAQILVEEVNYARMKVTSWIYNEYRQIAEAMGFPQYPKIRWDSTILKDIILYMTVVSQLVDRRMLSYRTSLERLGFDFDNELNNMLEEFPYVMDGYFGIIGSPWQQAKQGIPIDIPLNNTQRTQKAPKGTPSYGRPKGQVPTKKKAPKGMTNSEFKQHILEVSRELGLNSLDELILKLRELHIMEDNSE